MGKLKDLVDNHPMFVAAGVLLTGIGIGAAPIPIMESAHDKDTSSLDAEIERLGTELGAVTRTVGGEQANELRTDEILVSESEAADLSAKLMFIEADDIYAPDIPSRTDWGYTATDQAAFTSLTTGLTREQVERIYGEELADSRVSLWRSPDSQTVRIAENDELVTFPYVAVERVDIDSLVSIVSRASGSHDMDEFLEGDPLGAMFQLNIVNSVSISGVAPSLVSSIQRTENALYFEVMMVLSDVEVDGVETARFYIKREFILLRTTGGLVSIVTNLPSQDRRSSDASLVTELLSGLRIVD